MNELTFPISGLLFTLITILRQVISQIRKQKILSDLNMSAALMSQNQSLNQQQQPIDSINLNGLNELFKKILDYLLNSSLTNYKVRTHLYATILNYLMVFDDDDESSPESVQKTANKFSSSKATLMHENFRVLSSNMSSLLKQICSDSCEALNITTMMGLSLMNKIIDIDINNTKWIKFINDNGYITCIVNSILNTDNQLLEECFHSQMKNEKIIYIFETKIALFLSMSKSVFGVELLVKNGLINILAACTVFNLRIKFDR